MKNFSIQAQGMSFIEKTGLQDLVLFGGEDYAICVTISERERDSVSAVLGDNFPCLRIGKVTAQAGIRLLDQNLQPITVNDKTWQHFLVFYFVLSLFHRV